MNFYKVIDLNKLKKISAIVLIILWLIVIFCLSAMSGTESNKKSKAIISKDLSIGTKVTSKINKENSNNSKSNVNKTQVLNDLNVVLRKCMHGFVYLTLCIIILIALKIFNIKSKKKYIIAILCCFLYACTDEFHQSFVDGRTSSFIDVLIDTSGAMIGAGMWSIYCKIRF